MIFHDSNLIIDAILNVARFLDHTGIAHQLHLLPDNVAVISLGKRQTLALELFSPRILEQRTFVVSSKRFLHEQIAASVAQGSHLAT